MCEPGGSLFGGFAANWRDYDAPFHVKLRLLLRNFWLKGIRLSLCCGNGGEPGC